jgi:hypothetical protein
MMLALGLVMAAAAGCAHGAATAGGGGRDLRGTAHVGAEARLLLVGPARLVHADGERPVEWFVARKVSGGDRDCAVAPAARAVLAEAASAHLTVEAGQVLCASVPQGATDVSWHELVEAGDNMWALR